MSLSIIAFIYGEGINLRGSYNLLHLFPEISNERFVLRLCLSNEKKYRWL